MGMMDTCNGPLAADLTVEEEEKEEVWV